MRSENFVIIQGWMCNELELKGNELLVFALIYGFSQDGASKFRGTRQYIANTFNISRPTVDKALQGLLDKQYICKEGFDDFVNPNIYWVNLEVVKKLYMGGCKETLQGRCKETLLNNTNKQTIKNNKTNSKELVENFQFGKTKATKDSLYSKCTAMINDFTRDKTLISDLTIYLHILLEMRKDGYILYANVWKGLLKKLKDLSDDPAEQHKIVSQSVERGYKSFFPVSNFSGKQKPWEDGVTCHKYTKEELLELEELDRQRELKGLRTKF